MTQTEAARLDRITSELEKTLQVVKQTQATVFFMAEEKRRMNDILFRYASGLLDGGELARKFLNGER